MAKYRIVEIIETNGYGNEKKSYIIQVKKFYYLFYKNLSIDYTCVGHKRLVELRRGIIELSSREEAIKLCEAIKKYEDFVYKDNEFLVGYSKYYKCPIFIKLSNGFKHYYDYYLTEAELKDEIDRNYKSITKSILYID